MDHSPGFLKMVDQAKPHVHEISVAQAADLLKAEPQAVLLDVREDHEWNAGHAAGAQHLGKGILERDLEKSIPEKDRVIIMYCGGGFRSILTAHAAQQMGYRRVFSMQGGYKALPQAPEWSKALKIQR